MGDDEKDKDQPEDQWDDARKKVEQLEDDQPSDPKDWPDDEAKYVTFGGGEGDHGYDEGPEKNLGPSSTRRFEDGSIEVEGEKVENPEERKMESIRGNSDHPADQKEDSADQKED